VTPTVRARLRDGGIDHLVGLLLDDLLDRPAAELVEPRWLAERLAAAARSAAADPQVESWFRDRVTDARVRVPAGTADIPGSIVAPLRDVLQRPYVPDRAILGAILDHPTARLLLKNLFQDLVLNIVRRVRNPLPSARSPLGFGGLKKLGEGMLGAVGHELEHQVEAKAREFMDAGIERLVGQLADMLCDPQLASDYGAWRAHALDVLLATDLRVLAGEVEKLDPDSLVATGAALVRGIANTPELTDQLTTVLTAAFEASEGRSLRALLGGLEQHGIEAVREVLVERGRAVLETPAFEAWWDDLHRDERP
jgi:hypothetical protein